MKNGHRIILGLLIAVNFCLFIPPTVFCQTDKLGIVSYTPPKGWTKTSKVENILAFSEVNPATGGFCIITLHGATPSTGNPTTDFTNQWNSLVVTPLKAKADPPTETQAADGWTITAGAAPVDSDGVRGAAFLTVFSGYGKTVSVLAVFNAESYMNPVAVFVSGIDLDKTAAPAAIPPTNSPTFDSSGKLIVPLPARQLTVADLEGEWGEDTKRISTTYVYRSSGAYAGSDNLTFRSKMTITKGGGYLNDFFAIQNGKKIIENTNGSVSINGRVFSITQKSTAKYVIRGWLELPEMTILIICGPWYDNDEIPSNIFTNPEQGANLNNTWVRKK